MLLTVSVTASSRRCERSATRIHTSVSGIIRQKPRMPMATILRTADPPVCGGSGGNGAMRVRSF